MITLLHYLYINVFWSFWRFYAQILSYGPNVTWKRKRLSCVSCPLSKHRQRYKHSTTTKGAMRNDVCRFHREKKSQQLSPEVQRPFWEYVSGEDPLQMTRVRNETRFFTTKSISAFTFLIHNVNRLHKNCSEFWKQLFCYFTSWKKKDLICQVPKKVSHVYHQHTPFACNPNTLEQLQACV